MSDVEPSLAELLPAYVAGRLPREQASGVEAAARADPLVAAEIEFYRALRQHVRADALAGAGPGELGWARLARAMAGRAEPRAARPARFWQLAAAAMALIVVIESALLVAGAFGDRERRYVPAGEAPSSLQPTIAVALVASAREEQLRALLVSLNARIVDGPSALGFYTLRFATEAERRAALAAIRDRPDLVESVVE
jgi:hypothetical protein